MNLFPGNWEYVGFKIKKHFKWLFVIQIYVVSTCHLHHVKFDLSSSKLEKN
ncbi:MAG: hypothetical protein Q8760_02530 [Candidatus Phytoplasma australasiaticum]|nr:hypothetical protein [Candidatus Phytoplasma australasiaticum]